MILGGIMKVVVAIEVLIAGALVLSHDVGGLWWAGIVAAIALSATLVALPGRMSLAERTGLRLGLWRRRLIGAAESDGSKPDQAPFDIPVSGSNAIGARWDGTALVTVVRIDTPPPTLSFLDPSGCRGLPPIPLAALAECVRQFDIRLESVDVISHGIRTHGTGPVAQVYRRTLGPLPATAYRSVLVVLRLDPSHCPDAVARRGGGSEGALRTAMIATRRVANRLAGQGLSASILTAAQITAATGHLAHGADTGEVREDWDAVTSDRLRMCTYAVDPDHLDEVLDAVWAVPSISTTVTMRLSPAGPGEVAMRTLVRFNSASLDHSAITGLIELPGRQRTALAASLPVGAAAELPPIGRQTVPFDSLSDVALSATGCGQLVGADHAGRAVAVDLLGGPPHRVSIAGGLHLAQQVLLRAIAVGARVLVYTDHGAVWQQFVTAVGDPGLLALAGGRNPQGHYTVAVFHGVAPAPVDAPTVITVVPPGSPGEPADVRLEQNEAAPQDIWVATPTGSAMVTMVATPDEMAFIGSTLPVPSRV